VEKEFPVHILAVDTSDARGSVALLHGSEVIASKRHDAAADYSGWLLPACEEILKQGSTRMEDLELLAVSTGPGSFTGLRVGLTTVKAWTEVYGTKAVGVSRLEAMAHLHLAESASGLIAACYDAQRGQIFGGLYRSSKGRLRRIEEEMVISAQGFLDWVNAQAGAEAVNWISLDPQLTTSRPGWQEREERGDKIQFCEPDLARAIGKLAAQRARSGYFSDPLELDANYVRRSDAEIFWKGR
jgi:tRNA threonylcarbamoyladenosine biosynthesis protein TsaB